MKKILYFLCLITIYSCTNNGNENDSNNENQLPVRHMERGSNEPVLKLTFYFKNDSDTVFLGEETDLAIKIENNKFDSMNLLLGKVMNNKLIDTLGVLPVKNNSVYFKFLPSKIGVNNIEGLIQQYKISNENTIVRSTPFSTTYFVKKRE